MNGGDNACITFDASSSLTVAGISRDENLSATRFAVRDGTTWYVSLAAGNSLTDPSTTTWAVYDPNTSLDFDAGAAAFAPHVFSDVTGVGIYKERDTACACRMWWEFDSFEVDAVVTPKPPPPTSSSMLLVDFGRTDYVTGNQKFRNNSDGTLVTGDFDGDTMADDARREYAYMDETGTPLNPQTGYDDSQPSAVFFGGAQATHFDSTTAGFDTRTVNNNTNGDRPSLRNQQNSGHPLATTHIFMFWDQSGFLNGGDTETVVFNPQSMLSINFSRYEAMERNRFVVRDGTTFYVSEAQGPLMNPNGTRWAPYDPSSGLDFDEGAAVFASHNFSDITAFGFYAERDAPCTSCRMWMEFTDFEVQAAFVQAVALPPGALNPCDWDAAITIDGMLDANGYTHVTEDPYAAPVSGGSTTASDFIGESASCHVAYQANSFVDDWHNICTMGYGTADIQQFRLSWTMDGLHLLVQGPTAYNDNNGEDRMDLFIAIDTDNITGPGISAPMSDTPWVKRVDFAGWDPEYFVAVERGAGAGGAYAELRSVAGGMLASDTDTGAVTPGSFEFATDNVSGGTEIFIPWSLFGVDAPPEGTGAPWNFAIYTTFDFDNFDVYDSAPGVGNGGPFEQIGDSPWDADWCTPAVDPVTGASEDTCTWFESDDTTGPGVNNGDYRQPGSDNAGTDGMGNEADIDTIQEYFAILNVGQACGGGLACFVEIADCAETNGPGQFTVGLSNTGTIDAAAIQVVFSNHTTCSRTIALLPAGISTQFVCQVDPMIANVEQVIISNSFFSKTVDLVYALADTPRFDCVETLDFGCLYATNIYPLLLPEPVTDRPAMITFSDTLTQVECQYTVIREWIVRDLCSTSLTHLASNCTQTATFTIDREPPKVVSINPGGSLGCVPAGMTAMEYVEAVQPVATDQASIAATDVCNTCAIQTNWWCDTYYNDSGIIQAGNSANLEIDLTAPNDGIHTIPAFQISNHAYRYLVVTVSGEQGVIPQSVRYGGVDLTVAASAAAGSSMASIWILEDPPAGAADIAVDLSGGNGVAIYAVELGSVRAFGPITSDSASGLNAATPSLNLGALQRNGFLISASEKNNNDNFTVSSTVPEILSYDDNNSGGWGAKVHFGPLAPLAGVTQSFDFDTRHAAASVLFEVNLEDCNVTHMVRKFKLTDCCSNVTVATISYTFNDQAPIITNAPASDYLGCARDFNVPIAGDYAWWCPPGATCQTNVSDNLYTNTETCTVTLERRFQVYSCCGRFDEALTRYTWTREPILTGGPFADLELGCIANTNQIPPVDLTMADAMADCGIIAIRKISNSVPMMIDACGTWEMTRYFQATTICGAVYPQSPIPVTINETFDADPGWNARNIGGDFNPTFAGTLEQASGMTLGPGNSGHFVPGGFLLVPDSPAAFSGTYDVRLDDNGSNDDVVFVFNYQDDSNFYYILLSEHPGRVGLYSVIGGTITRTSFPGSPTVVDDTFHHVSVSYDAASGELMLVVTPGGGGSGFSYTNPSYNPAGFSGGPFGFGSLNDSFSVDNVDFVLTSDPPISQRVTWIINAGKPEILSVPKGTNYGCQAEGYQIPSDFGHSIGGDIVDNSLVISNNLLTSIEVDRGLAGTQEYTPANLIGVTLTCFDGLTDEVLFVPQGDPAPPMGTRATLMSDDSLATGVINPDNEPDNYCVAFDQPVCNSHGPDILIFEIDPTTGGSAGGDALQVSINGQTIGQNAWKLLSGFIPLTLYGTNPNATPNTLADLETFDFNDSRNVGDQAVYGIAIDLTDFGVAPGACVGSMMFASTAGVDPVMVAGLPGILDESRVDVTNAVTVEVSDWVQTNGCEVTVRRVYTARNCCGEFDRREVDYSFILQPGPSTVDALAPLNLGCIASVDQIPSPSAQLISASAVCSVVSIDWTGDEPFAGDVCPARIQTESMELDGLFQIMADTNAEGGAYIVSPGTGNGNTEGADQAPPAWARARAEFTVLTPGYYQLRFRVYKPNAADNTIFIQIDDEPTDGYLYPGFQLAGDWHEEIAQDVNVGVIEIPLTCGEHSINLFHRERGFGIDWVQLERVADLPEASCDCPDVLVRTYEVEDLCGNVITARQCISYVEDSEPPRIVSVPAPQDFGCVPVDPMPVGDPAVVAASDDVAVVSTTMVMETRTVDDCEVTVTRTWRVEDCCGKFDLKDQVYTYIIAPTNLRFATELEDLDLGCLAHSNQVTPPVPSLLEAVADPGFSMLESQMVIEVEQDAYIQGPTGNTGASHSSGRLLLKYNSGGNEFSDEFNRKAYIQFDVSALAGLNDVASASFEFEFMASGAGSLNDPNFVWDFSIWGLNDGVGEAWIPGTAWNSIIGNLPNSPNFFNDDAIRLGGFSLAGDGDQQRILFNSPELMEFLAADTDGLITLMLARDTEPNGNDPGMTYVHAVKAQEHADGGAQLIVNRIVAGAPVCQEIELLAEQDTFIRGGTSAGTIQNSSQATTVFKGSNNLNFRRKTYLKFNLQSVDVERLSGARLELSKTSNDARFFNVYALNGALDGWDQSSITWNNAPANSSGANAADAGTFTLLTPGPLGSAVGTYTMDASLAVKQEAMGDGTLSIVVASASNIGPGIGTLASLENASQVLRPKLILSYCDSCPVTLMHDSDTLITNEPCRQVIERVYMATNDCGQVAFSTQLIQYAVDEVPRITNTPPDMDFGCVLFPPSLPDPFANFGASGASGSNYMDYATVDNCSVTVRRHYTVTNCCGVSDEADIFFTWQYTNPPPVFVGPDVYHVGCVLDAGNVPLPNPSLFQLGTTNTHLIVAETFSGGVVPPGWQEFDVVAGGSDPDFQVVADPNGNNIFLQANPDLSTGGGTTPGAYMLLPEVYKSFTASVDFKLNDQAQGSEDAVFIWGWQDDDPDAYYMLALNDAPSNVDLFTVNNGTRTEVESSILTGQPLNDLEDDLWYRLTVGFDGDNGDLFVTIVELNTGDTFTDVYPAFSSLHPAGRIGIGAFNDAPSFDNLFIQGIDDGPLAPYPCPASITHVADGPTNFIDGVGCSQMFDRVYLATPACGVSTLFTQDVIFVIDAVPEIMAIPFGSNLNYCTSNDFEIPPMLPGPWDGFVATNYIASNVVTNIFTTNDCVVTLEREYTITNCCGRFDRRITTFTWTKTPDIQITALRDYYLGCIDHVNQLPTPSELLLDVSNECGFLEIEWLGDGLPDDFVLPLPDDLPLGGWDFTQRTYRITDICGNMFTNTQYIFYTLRTEPEILSVEQGIDWGCQTNGWLPPVDTNAFTYTNQAWEGFFDYLVTITNELTSTGCTAFVRRTFRIEGWCGEFDRWDVTHTYTIKPEPATVEPLADKFVGCLDHINQLPEPNITLINASSSCAVVEMDFIIETNWNLATPGPTNLACTSSVQRIYEVTDLCGQSTRITQTISWVLNDPNDNPQVMAVESGRFWNCQTNGWTVPTARVFAATNYVGGIETTEVYSTDIDECIGTLVRTYTVRDCCGDEASASVTHSWRILQPPPTLTGEEEIDLGCLPDDSQVPLPSTTQFALEAGCGAEVVLSSNGVMQTNGCARWLTRVYTAIDNCGQSGSITQTFRWTWDELDPKFVSLPGGWIGCGSSNDVPGWTADSNAIVIADNCGAQLMYLGETQAVEGCIVTVTRNWMAMDGCQNSEVAQTIWSYQIVPTNRPVITGPTSLPVGCVASAAEVPPANTGLLQIDFTCELIAFYAWPDGPHVPTSNDCEWTFARVFYAEDACGVWSTWTQQVTYTIETGARILYVPAWSNYNCQVSPPPAPDIADVVVSPSNLIVEVESDVIITNPVDCSVTLTRTFYVEDCCGNFDRLSSTIRWTPLPDIPRLMGITNIALGCIADRGQIPLANPAQFMAVSACGVEVKFLREIEHPPVACSNSLTRTYRVTDLCGQTNDIQQTISWLTEEIPEVTGIEAGEFLGCSTGIPVNLPPATTGFWDIRWPTLARVSTNLVTNGCTVTLTRTYRVETCCGLFHERSVDFSWTDEPGPPAIAGPNLIRLGCISSVGLVPVPSTSQFTLHSDCGGEIFYVGETGHGIFSGNGCAYGFSRIYMASNYCGATSIFLQGISYRLDDNPVKILEVEPPRDFGCVQAYPVPEADVDQMVTSGGFLTQWVTEVVSSNGCDFSLKRTYWVEDCCDNVDHMDVTFTWRQDSQNPSIAPPVGWEPVITAGCNPGIGELPPVNIAQFSVTDNCGADIRFLGDRFATNGCTASVTRVYQAYDECWNTSSITQQYVFLLDHVAPEPSIMPTSVTLSCNATDLPPPSETIVDVVNTCGSVLETQIVQTAMREVGCEIWVTRLYEFTDECGNKGTAEQIIRYREDHEPPLLIEQPDDQTLGCNQPIPAPDPTAIRAFDRCGGVDVQVGGISVTNDGCVETTVHIYWLIDDCGNTTATEVTYTRSIDTTSPVLSCPTGLVLQAESNCRVAMPQLGSMGTDGCGGDLIQSQSIPFGSQLIGPSSNRVVVTVEDECGNTASCQFDIVVQSDCVPEHLPTGILLEKTAYLGHDGGVGCTNGGQEVVQATNGSDITYCFRIVNVGQTALTDVYLSDTDITPPLVQSIPGNLNPGEETRWYVEHKVQRAFVNAASVTATPVDGQPFVSDQDTATVELVRPAMDIQKTVMPAGGSCATSTEYVDGPAGRPITYCFTVRNIGDTSLLNVQLSDPAIGLNQPLGNLAPGTETHFQIDTTITGALINVAWARADIEVDGQVVGRASDNDSARVSLGEAAIAGAVWTDTSADGRADDERLENLGLEGIPVNLYRLTEAGPRLMGTQATGPGGAYAFTGLPSGSYRVSVNPADVVFPDGPTLVTTPTELDVDLDVAQTRADNNFGFLPEPTAVELLSLQAVLTAQGVVIEWQAASQRDLLGYRITKNGEPIGGMLSVRGQSGSYVTLDEGSIGGIYRLEAVGTDLNIETLGETLTRANAAPRGDVSRTIQAENGVAELITDGPAQNYLVLEFDATPTVTDTVNERVLIGEAIEVNGKQGVYFHARPGLSLRID